MRTLQAVFIASLALPVTVLLLKREPFPLPDSETNHGPSISPSAAAHPSPSLSPPSFAEPNPLPVAADEPLTLRLGELLRAHHFADALALAETIPASSPESRQEWFATIFAAWARAVPAEAPALAEILARHTPDAPVFQSFALAWAESAPAALADHALTLPAGKERDFALRTALTRWTLLSPAESADWIARLTDPIEFDQAAALLVERTDSIHRPTATALTWAENLADPTLRLRALTHVLREWAERDPVAARRFAESSPTLSPDHRSALLASLVPPVSES